MEIEQHKQVSLAQARAFEEVFRQLPQIEIETSHVIHGSMYARTIFIPAGTVLTGVLTKADNICIVHGDISVTTDAGVVRLTGYNVLPATKGYKRVGQAHADTYWTMLIHTDAQTVEDAEHDLTDETGLLQTNYLKAAELAQEDYKKFLVENGLTEESIQEQMDLVPVHCPSGCLEKIQLGSSLIHNIGIFSVVPLAENEIISPARLGNQKCIAGRYTNHSPTPNAKMVLNSDNSVDLVALCAIQIGTEITVDYRSSIKLAVHLDLEI